MIEPTKEPTKETGRDRILHAAARVYLRRGPASTVEEIATEADYSAGALYKHFAGKDAIFQTLAEEIGKNFARIFEAAPPVKLGFEQHLKWVLYGLAEFAQEEHDMFVASVMTSALVFAGTGRATLLQNSERIQKSFVAIMQKGIDEGRLKPADPALYVTMFGGALQALNVEWIRVGPFNLKERIDELFDLFLAGAGA